MAFKLSKAERAELDSFATRLSKENADLTAVLEEQGAIIEAAYERINGAIDTYNGVLADAHSFIEDISQEAQSEFDDKSERWQEGDRGSEVQEWIESLDNACSEMEELEQFAFETPSIDLADHADLINQLPNEPGY